MKIENIEIIKIKPYGKNAKLHPQSQIDNVAESISQFGWQQPIVVDKDFVIIIGHCRYLAAQKLGLLDVPCVVADSLSEEQVKKLRLIDNKTNESDWDFDLLKTELGDLDLSGSTLIVCEQMGRKCYMMEYDPMYVDVIIKRWEEFTGKKAIKL